MAEKLTASARFASPGAKHLRALALSTKGDGFATVATAMASAKMDALLRLKERFEARGYVRSPRDPSNPTSHRGYELRFSARTAAERDRIVRWLRTIGIRAGKPFAKASGAWRIPVYGRAQVEELIERLNIG